MTWQESKNYITGKAPLHSIAATKNKFTTTLRTPIQSPRLSFEEFKQKYQVAPLHDRKDFMKAWLVDHDDIPTNLNKGINIIPLRNDTLIIYANKNGKAVGVLNLYRTRIEHIVVHDKYTHRGIATVLIKEAKKLGANDIAPPISPEFAHLAYKFMIGEL